MEQFTPRNQAQRQLSTWWSHPLIVATATLVVGVISITFWARPRETVSSDPESILQQEIKQFASEVSDLQEAVREATHSATQEKIIRDQLLMQKEGEYVVQIPLTALPSPTPQLAPKQKTNWELWWEEIQ